MFKGIFFVKIVSLSEVGSVRRRERTYFVNGEEIAKERNFTFK